MINIKHTYNPILNRILDKEKRVKIWPAKRLLRQAALAYIASKMEDERIYTESEINELLSQWHTFNDHVLLRRELHNNSFLARTPDGSKYWKIVSLPNTTDIPY